ncbi:MAG: amidohydrolase family protein [Isosphaeraceae bacterium]|nr:amidohydrolase family protein [Isosphaeraceae bacterium]
MFAAPGTILESGTVVVRDGLIESVGPADKTDVPFDAQVVDGAGLYVYPGLLDLYTTLGQPAGAVRSQTGPGRTLDLAESAPAHSPPDNRNGLTPEFAVGRVLDLPDSLAAERRKLGFTAFVAAPAGAIATGQSALVSLAGLPRREAVLQSPIALHINLRPPFQPEPVPALDQEGATRRVSRTGARAPYPAVLMGAVAHLRQAMIDAERAYALQAASEKHGGLRPPVDPALDALHAARAKILPVWWEANTRDEIHRALNLAEEFGTTVVIVGGSEAGQVAERLKAHDVPVVLRLDFPAEPRLPTEDEYRKLDPAERDVPLKVLADRHAKWKEQLATAAVLAKAGVRFAFATDGLSKPETFALQLRRVVAEGLAPAAAVDALTGRAAEIAGVASRLGTLSPGKLGHVVVLSAPLTDESARVRYMLLDGLKFEFDHAKSDEAPPRRVAQPEPKVAASAPGSPVPATAEKAAQAVADRKPDPPFVDVASELDADRAPRLKTGGNVLIKNATILTVTKGTIPKGSILVREGKIAEIGESVPAPAGTAVIDAEGMVVMPGIIDTHSHIAMQGNINESSLSIVPEVRVKDVLSGTDPALYRALAGGTTVARLLHGSADVVGGQDAVIKLKHGLAGRDLLVKDAPQGVKVALGENVTRHPGRFPNTRMGVEATLDRAFEEARAYQALWKQYEANKSKLSPSIPPRRDLRLEALAGILDGSIRVECHSYRGDEILMLLRLCARHGVPMPSLHHALEGYKVAPEIAAAGASVSTFADWWAYKVEAFDAIPYNAALLTRAGVRVSLKSDSEEVMRHLYLEAAKAVKYGDVNEEQALAMITINPARELGLERRLGSIEKGKDADLAIFNAHPFDGFARCEMTLVDGEVWFQRGSKDGRLAPRAGQHFVMPAPSHGLRDRILEILNNPKGVYALVGATLHPVGGDDIPDGTLVVSEGKIVAIGGAGTRIPGSAQTIDVQGLDVWPGLVAAGTPLGLYEVGSLGETQDWADSAQYQPELRASSALRVDSELIPVTRANGILSAYVQPLGGTFCGQGCAVDLNGWVPREMILADPVALHVRIPDALIPGADGSVAGGAAERRKKRNESLAVIKDWFQRALAYETVRVESATRHVTPPPPDPRLAALVPYAKGEKPVVFHASRRGEILDALKFAGDLKLKAIISGGLEAWKVADQLKAAKVPVLIAGTLQVPADRTDPYDAPFTNPLRLHEAGVLFAIRPRDFGPEQATAPRNLPYEAAVAVAYGLPEIEALKAVTINPARILGIQEQVGSLEVGKRANIVVTAGHILQPTTRVKALFINGRPVSPESRHTRLYDKYLQRLAEVQAGLAPLGLEPRPAPAPSPVEPEAPAKPR